MESHMIGMHGQKNDATVQEVEARPALDKVVQPTDDIGKTNEIEEFLDREKEKLYTEAENWRKTSQDLDMDLKSALKANEKIIKEQLGIKEDYEKVTKVAGALQARVHTLEEEMTEMKINQTWTLERKMRLRSSLRNLKLI